MALIKCKNCGRMMSDRADFCPHCGCPKEFAAKEETSIKEENPIIEEDSVKEENSVTKAQTVSTTEDLNNNDNDDKATATQDTEEVVEEEGEEDNANKGLVALVIVLAVIAIGFGGYIWYNRSSNNVDSSNKIIEVTPMDTTEYQTMEPDTEVVATDAKEEAVVDTAMTYNNSNNSQEQHQVKEGFNTNSDVKNFVIGNSYYHNGVTLKITENGVYANDNKISSSSPVFKRVSQFVGKVTARPSISISIKWEGNKLVDNNSGDVYYEN